MEFDVSTCTGFQDVSRRTEECFDFGMSVFFNLFHIFGETSILSSFSKPVEWTSRTSEQVAREAAGQVRRRAGELAAQRAALRRQRDRPASGDVACAVLANLPLGEEVAGPWLLPLRPARGAEGEARAVLPLLQAVQPIPAVHGILTLGGQRSVSNGFTAKIVLERRLQWHNHCFGHFWASRRSLTQ